MPRLPHDPRPSFLDAKVEPQDIATALAYALDAAPDEAAAVLGSWAMTARRSQIPHRRNWDVWVMMAGRGFGKTRAGAEWVRQLVGDPHHRGPKSHMRIALVAASLHEARSVMVEGESGLLALYAAHPDDAPTWEPSLRQLSWPNGARAFIYGAAEPDALRGPQHHYAWCDEIAKWPHGKRAWMNLRLGLRLGLRPRVLATTTPRYCTLVSDLVRDADNKASVIISSGRMDDNRTCLPVSARTALRDDYGDSRIGRQELDGELLEGADNALWTPALLHAARARYDPGLPWRRVVIGVDPATTGNGDACGIIVAALLDPEADEGGALQGGDSRYGAPPGLSQGLLPAISPHPYRAVILSDESVGHTGPSGWAARVNSAAQKWGAGLVIAESNQGGEMVRKVLEAAGCCIPIRLTHAHKSKAARAEPVSVWYETGRIAHADLFPELEAQMCGLTMTQGYIGPGTSPDRADALVYALTALLSDAMASGPRVLGWG